jgi:hypothetical protein
MKKEKPQAHSEPHQHHTTEESHTVFGSDAYLAENKIQALRDEAYRLQSYSVMTTGHGSPESSRLYAEAYKLEYATKNHGVKLFFVCTFKNEKQRVIRFSRLGMPTESQTFQNSSREQLKRFHVDGWYRLLVPLENLVECDHSEPYQPEFIKAHCRICGVECYFDKIDLHVCNTCTSKIERYAELLQEMGEYAPITDIGSRTEYEKSAT